jgi:(p)ppGpp synthase/HD superfamily hydrolase
MNAKVGSKPMARELVNALDLKEMDGVLLVADIRSRSVDAGLAVESIDTAIALAAWAHRTQRRRARGDFPKTAYIEHPLRNAARVLRWGVKSEAIVIACILHDSVEDHAVELAGVVAPGRAHDEAEAREVVLGYYATTFGADAARLVRAMSNPLEESADLDEATKQRMYRTHVLEEIADAEVAVCKLSDLADNALSLHQTDPSASDPRTPRLARKYAPLLPVFLDRISEPDVRSLMSADGNRAAADSIAAGIVRLSKLVG